MAPPTGVRFDDADRSAVVDGTGPKIDAAVSFVLFGTAISEVERAVAQVAAAECKTHVYIVDNSEPPLGLPTFGADVTIIRPGRNLGYGAGHNRAIQQSSGARYHVVMNTDVTYERDVLDRLVEFMDSNPDVGLVMPRVVYPDGRLQHLCRLLPDPIDLAARGFFRASAWAKRLSRRYEFHDWSHDRVESFPFLSGCFMVVRRSVLEQIGGFDERFFLYAEDLDLSRRINQVARTLFVPQVSIAHEYRTLATRSMRRQLYKVVSLTKYFNKWGWIIDRERSSINRATLERVYGSRTGSD